MSSTEEKNRKGS